MMLRPSSINQIPFKYPYSFRVLATEPIAYWKLDETSGSIAVDSSGNGFDGTYSNVTLGGDTFLNDDPTAVFNGANSVVNVYSAAFAAAFGKTLGSLMLWSKTTTLAVQRYAINFQADSANRLILDNQALVNIIRGFYRANNVTNQQAKVITQTDYNQLIVTWNLASNRVIAYINGVPGVTLTPLGTWVNNLSATTVCIGAENNAGLNSWLGSISNVAVWNKELSQSEIDTIVNPVS